MPVGPRRRFAARLALVALLAPLASPSLGCSSSSHPAAPTTDAGSDTSFDAPDADAPDAELPPPAFASTVDGTWDTVKGRADENAPIDYAKGTPAGDSKIAEAFVAAGYGELVKKPGEKHTVRGIGVGDVPPTPSASAKLLARFVHMPDFQLLDDESPSRFAGLDDAGETFAYGDRPHDAEMCVLVNQAIHTVNQVHAKAPLDFVLLGGDNIDNAQANEAEWVLDILDGTGSVKCDSGNVDDPVPGPANDGKDVFTPEGLEAPWYWVMGNHVLFNGNMTFVDATGALDPAKVSLATGTTAPNGTRVYSGTTWKTADAAAVADARRVPLSRKQLLQKVHDKTGGPGPVGHGIGADQLASGKAIHAWDVGARLRMIAFDTGAETGGAGGLARKGDVDTYLKPLLAKAKTDGKVVIVTMHHPLDQMGDGSGAYGAKQADAMDPAAFKELLASYDNVIASVVGHTHANRIEWIAGGAGGARGFWEIMTSAIADWPQQVRVFEVYEESATLIRLRVTAVDLDFTTGATATAAMRGRTFCAMDWSTGWGGGFTGAIDDRNVDVFVKLSN
jgi:3',5'-cyclic AMP phosphodiesterase CpdA